MTPKVRAGIAEPIERRGLSSYEASQVLDPRADTGAPPTRERSIDPSPDLAAKAPPLAPVFPLEDRGTGLVLYGGPPGEMRIHWTLERNDFERVAASFPPNGGYPVAVVRLRRVRPQGGTDQAQEVPLGPGVRDGAGERGVRIPTDHCRYHAELGLTNAHGGWLMLARSNGLYNAAGIGLDLVRPRKEGLEGRLGPEPPEGVLAAARGPLFPGSTAVVPPRESPPSESLRRESPPSESLRQESAPAESLRHESPPAGSLRLESPPLASPPLDSRIEPALDQRSDAVLAREFPLVPWTSSQVSAPKAAEGTAGHEWVGRGQPQAPEVPRGGGARGTGPSVAGWSASPGPARLEASPARFEASPTRPEASPSSPDHVSQAGVYEPLGSAPTRIGVPLVPLTYERPPERVNGLELEAELRVTGRAPAGSTIDLFGFPYRVGPGGRFQLYLPVTDPELLRRALEAAPPAELTHNRDD